MRVICVPLDGIGYSDAARYEALLPRERREKISRFKHDSDKLRSLAAGLLIHHVTGGAPIVISERGKPYIADGSVHFSVSHSGSYAAIAVDISEVGLDIEKLPDRDHMRIAERHFHPEELEYLRGAEDSARAFTRVWTRKEAYLKQLGTGIADDLRAFDTVSGELSQRIVSVDMEGYVLSVCADRSITESDIDISFLELSELIL